MNKRKSHAFGKDIYLLGEDESGINHWLEYPSWDCDWYWGCNYIKTYTNNRNPEQARDMNSHQHFEKPMGWLMEFNGKQPTLKSTPFTENERWAIVELAKSINLLKDTAGYFHSGGAGITGIKSLDRKNLEQAKHINKVLLPELFEAMFKIMTP